MQDRVNLLSDAWALVQANRAPISLYLGLLEKLPHSIDFAQVEQIITVFDYINRLLLGQPERDTFQKYARSVLRPSFEAVGWDPKPDEAPNLVTLRASLIEALGDLNDEEIIAGCSRTISKLSGPIRNRCRPIFAIPSLELSAATPTKRPGTNCTNSD